MIRNIDFDKTTSTKTAFVKVTPKQKAAETLYSCLEVAVEFPDEQITGWEEMTEREQELVIAQLHKLFDRMTRVIEKSLA